MTNVQCAIGILCLTFTVACAPSPSTTPTPTPTPTPPSTITLTGHVTATNGGQALAGITATIGVAPVGTNGAGTFVAQLNPTSTLSLQLAASSIVTRITQVAASSSREVTIDAIALDGSFDATFYRQLVRDALDTPNASQPLRRWTTAPQVYLRTVDDGGAAIDARTLDSTEQAIRETMPLWSPFTATITRGVESRVGSSGWITVVWRADASQAVCGLSDVALSGGQVQLFYRRGGGCRCVGGPEIRPRTVKHELGHAMGFYHTDNANDVMAPGGPGCDTQPSARELYHAAIAYRRPVGNLDPDTDPSGTVNLAPMRAR